jgi:hypothetical protein
MFIHDHLLSTHIDPECAGVAPAHAVETMQSIVDPDLERSLYSLSVSKHSGAIMAGERCFDDCGVGMNVVKVDHDFSPALTASSMLSAMIAGKELMILAVACSIVMIPRL